LSPLTRKHALSSARLVECRGARTGNDALALILTRCGEVEAYLPLTQVHSPIFGRVLASSGFAVGGGVLAAPDVDPAPLFAAVEELALRQSTPSVELRGGPLPETRAGWTIKRESHCGFIRPLADSDEAELTTIPRKQRAEVRKSLAGELTVETGTGPPTATPIMASMRKACAIWARRFFRALFRCGAGPLWR
jgi:hypothetical protein